MARSQYPPSASAGSRATTRQGPGRNASATVRPSTWEWRSTGCAAKSSTRRSTGTAPARRCCGSSIARGAAGGCTPTTHLATTAVPPTSYDSAWDDARVSKSQRDSALILWDVDHTLVSIGGVSRVIYEHAFKSVIGRPLGRLASMTGRTERAIITETLELNGVESSQATVSRFYSTLGVAAQELEGHIRKSGRSLQGAADAISALRDGRVFQSVVTGNIRPIAEVKLGAFELADSLDLEIGGYGDDGSDRAVLVRLARERAEEKYGTSFADKRTFVIGDTPHDIKGAHDAGAFAVGVTTGSSPVEVLEKCGADLVLADLTNTEELHNAVFDSWAS